MSASRTSPSLEAVLGFVPPSVERDIPSLQRIRVAQSALPALITHWRSLDWGTLPRLVGLTTSPSEESRTLLNLLLDLGPSEPILCLEFDFARNVTVPDFSVVWPHCLWWQRELEVFRHTQFNGSVNREGVTWRLA